MTLVVDLATGIIEYVSDDVAGLGWSPAELEGRHASVLVEIDEGHEERFQAIREGKHVGTVSRLIHKDGRLVPYNFAAQPGNDGTCVVATGIPVGARPLIPIYSIQAPTGDPVTHISDTESADISQSLGVAEGGEVETAPPMYAAVNHWTQTTLGQRLEWSMARKGWGPGALAVRMGSSKYSGTIGRYLRDDVKRPHAETLHRMAKELGVDGGWLATGLGEP